MQAYSNLSVKPPKSAEANMIPSQHCNTVGRMQFCIANLLLDLDRVAMVPATLAGALLEY